METTTIRPRYCPTCARTTPHLQMIGRNFGDEVVYEDFECRICHT